MSDFDARSYELTLTGVVLSETMVRTDTSEIVVGTLVRDGAVELSIGIRAGRTMYPGGRALLSPEAAAHLGRRLLQLAGEPVSSGTASVPDPSPPPSLHPEETAPARVLETRRFAESEVARSFAVPEWPPSALAEAKQIPLSPSGSDTREGDTP